MLDTLNTTGDLEALCFNNVAEGLQIEFKLKEDPTTPTLSKIDKRNIAEAISSFANSDGGTLIFGVRTQRHGGADIAVDLVPIAEIAKFESNFRTVCSLNISPQISNVSVRSILFKGSGEGFLICGVERSDNRPHMSTAPGVHSFYRRSFEGSVPMTPSEIRDQILAVRDAVLEPVVSFPAGSSFAPHEVWISFRLGVRFSLKNVGRALCRNPFLRVRGDCELHSHSGDYDHALHTWKTTFAPGFFIHVDDQADCFTLSFNGLVRFDTLSQLFADAQTDFTESVIILPGSSNYNATTIGDKFSLDAIEFYLTFGAENALSVDRSFKLSRRELAQGVFKHADIANAYMALAGSYRRDLVDEFIHSD